VAGFALSFNTRQFNRLNTYGGLEQNQIAALSGAGYFTAPVGSVNTLPALVNAADATASLEARVRSYLAANCVQCHQPGGTATGNWDARPQVPTDSAALINGALVNTSGEAANRFAVPGDLAHSMVLKRIRGDGVPRMPPLATNERDLVSEQLLMDWITQSLPTRQSFTQWQTTHFGSPGNPEAGLTLDPDVDGQNNGLEFLQRSLPTVAGLPFLPTVQSPAAGDTIEISFLHPANRSCLVEVSSDMLNWSLWNVPGNDPRYPAVDTPRTLSGPKSGTNQNFRLRLGEL
jgi:mono/diheme cytochrome c family protein